jgi:hypothetical protein
MPDTVGSLLGSMRPKAAEEPAPVTGESEGEDFSAKFNTKIPKKLMPEFQAWVDANGKAGEIATYDIQGYWLNEVHEKGEDPMAGGAIPAKYAKPNNPLYGAKQENQGTSLLGSMGNIQ